MDEKGKYATSVYCRLLEQRMTVGGAAAAPGSGEGPQGGGQDQLVRKFIRQESAVPQGHAAKTCTHARALLRTHRVRALLRA